MKYKQFAAVNERNKKNFNDIKRKNSKLYGDIMANLNSSIRIVSVNVANSTVTIISNLRGTIYVTQTISDVIENIVNNKYNHVTNPAILQNWRGWSELNI